MKRRVGLYIVAIALLGASSGQAIAKDKTDTDSVASGHNLCVHVSSAKSCQVDGKTKTVKASLDYSKTDARTACRRVQKYARAAGGFGKGWQLEIHPGNHAEGQPLAQCDLDISEDLS